MAFHCFQMGNEVQGQAFAGRLMEYNSEEGGAISCNYSPPEGEDDGPEFVNQDWFGGFDDDSG